MCALAVLLEVSEDDKVQFEKKKRKKETTVVDEAMDLQKDTCCSELTL